MLGLVECTSKKCILFSSRRDHIIPKQFIKCSHSAPEFGVRAGEFRA